MVTARGRSGRKPRGKKKNRVITPIKGSTDVLVSCCYECGTTYRTARRTTDNKRWHKTLRCVNAHESQRCPLRRSAGGAAPRPSKRSRARAGSGGRTRPPRKKSKENHEPTASTTAGETEPVQTPGRSVRRRRGAALTARKKWLESIRTAEEQEREAEEEEEDGEQVEHEGSRDIVKREEDEDYEEEEEEEEQQQVERQTLVETCSEQPSTQAGESTTVKPEKKKVKLERLSMFRSSSTQSTGSVCHFEMEQLFDGEPTLRRLLSGDIAHFGDRLFAGIAGISCVSSPRSMSPRAPAPARTQFIALADSFEAAAISTDSSSKSGNSDATRSDATNGGSSESGTASRGGRAGSPGLCRQNASVDLDVHMAAATVRCAAAKPDAAQPVQVDVAALKVSGMRPSIGPVSGALRIGEQIGSALVSVCGA